MSDLTIAVLRLRHWKIFRGEHELRLEPKAYAIFAREEGDETRSNFLGKSSLAEAVDFALYGRLAPEFKSRKRGWISRGEKSGEVTLELSDGSIVKRSQSLTGSERLWCFPPGTPEKGATQEAAQQLIDELVGLSKEDFAATRYFRQGEMSRLITLDPGPRLDLVAGWLRLGPLQDCEADAAEVLREMARRRDAESASTRAAEQQEREVIVRAGAASDHEAPGDAMERIIADAGRRVLVCDGMVKLAEAGAEREREHWALREAAEAYDRVVEQGKTLAEELQGACGEASGPRGPLTRERLDLARAMMAAELDTRDVEFREAAEARGLADREVGTKRLLLAGGWGGGCPLVGAPCPSRAFVEAEGRKGEAAHADARAGLVRAGAAHDEAARRQREASARLSAFDHGAKRLGELRAEAARLLPSRRRWEAGLGDAAGEGRETLERARAVLRGAEDSLRDLERARDDARAACERAAAHRAEAERLGVAVRTAAAAVAVFGKAGAQRRMAEGALGEIEERANAMMARAGIPLSVAVEWSREGSGVAATCGACGEAFPRSERVKECERCGEKRGQQILHRLEIRPSAQSGGARDLAGIFVQLAAAAWLVEDRGARWSTAMLDEPLASLDAHHRRALSAHLPAILREAGVSQSFVIAHHAGFLDAMPARIVVTSKDGWSTVRAG